MSDRPRSKIGPLAPEDFEGEAAARSDAELQKAYGPDFFAELDGLRAAIEKSKKGGDDDAGN